MRDLTKVITTVLQNHKDARDSDFRTIGWVYAVLKPEVMNLPFKEVLWRHNDYDLPSFETIRRTRQKLQHDNPELRGEVYEKRMAKQSEYIDQFVKGI